MSVVKKMQFAMILFACLACFSESLSAAPETIVDKKDLKVCPEDRQDAGRSPADCQITTRSRRKSYK